MADTNFKKSCTNCEHLLIVNKAPFYAKCPLTDYAFLLWEEHTDNHSCELHSNGSMMKKG